MELSLVQPGHALDDAVLCTFGRRASSLTDVVLMREDKNVCCFASELSKSYVQCHAREFMLCVVIRNFCVE